MQRNNVAHAQRKLAETKPKVSSLKKISKTEKPSARLRQNEKT